MKHFRIELPCCPMEAYIPEVVGNITTPRHSLIICPGGGYHFRSDREAEPIALVFAAMGFNAYIVHYRVAPDVHPAPLSDVAHAVAWVRAHAQEHCANPDAIAVMGFSAGGHAAGHLGVRWHDAALMEQFGLTPAQARPNAMVLCYPVITGGKYAHRGSFDNLTGCKDLSIHEQYSLDQLVTDQAPPTFLWHTFPDGSVPVQNSYLMAAALAECGVTTEMHIYPKGGHGLSLCNPLTSTSADQLLPECAQWPELAARFLRDVMK